VEPTKKVVDNEECSWKLLLPKQSLGLHREESKFIVWRLSALFALDAFAGAFVMQTWIC